MVIIISLCLKCAIKKPPAHCKFQEIKNIIIMYYILIYHIVPVIKRHCPVNCKLILCGIVLYNIIRASIIV
jgi:hypothetical protein